MKQLETEVPEKNKDAFYAVVVGKVADGKSITIRMEPGATLLSSVLEQAHSVTRRGGEPFTRRYSKTLSEATGKTASKCGGEKAY